MIKVLIVDDSALMRRMISDILKSDSEIEVVDTAINGKFGVEKAKSRNPDVIIMDVEMPEMSGIEALKQIMNEKPVPVIMLSAFTKEGSAYTIEALGAGAIDFIEKPSGSTPAEFERINALLIEKIKAASKAKIRNLIVKAKKEKVERRTFFNPTRKKIIVIGTSTGGPMTLERILTELPDNMPSPLLIVQHMPPGFTKPFAERLNSICDIEVKEATNGEKIKDGVAYIAPGGFHMELEETDGDVFVALNMEPSELGVRPNVNKLFKSASAIFKENTIGIILTGMGNDGSEGAKAIKNMKGTIIAEAEESCVIFGMPKEVIKAGLADEVVPLEKIAVAMLQLIEI